MKKISKKQLEPIYQRNVKNRFDQLLKQNGKFSKLYHSVLYTIVIDHDLTLRELKALLMIIRLTFGFQRHRCIIKTSEFKLINIYPSDVSKTLRKLVDKGFIEVEKGKHKIISIGEGLLIHREPKEHEVMLSSLIHKNKRIPPK